MKNLKIFLFSILSLALLSGCASSMDTQVVEVQAKKGEGTLFIYRPHDDITRKKRYDLYIDGKFHAMLRDGVYYELDKKVGTYKIEAKEDVEYEADNFMVEVKVREGKKSYVRFGAESIGHLKLKKVRKNFAVSESDLIAKPYY